MKQYYFTMEMHPEGTRIDAWHEALAQCNLQMQWIDRQTVPFGTIISAITPMGIAFNRVTSCAQGLTFHNPQEEFVWLVAHIAGRAEILRESTRTSLAVGDVFFGKLDSSISLSLRANSRLLFVKFPKDVLKARFKISRIPTLGRLSGRDGLGHVVSGFLTSFADTIAKLKDDEIWTVEGVALEFLIAALATSAMTEPLTGPSSSVTASLYRISQLIEIRLGEPNLSASDIATTSGVSTRYLQKLFKSAGTSFSQTLRRRRLERSRLDIVNPLYAHLSISDICFRWGFNDAAHFSRAFHEQYGVSPRDYRRKESVPITQNFLVEFARGWPDGNDALAENRKASDGRGVAQPRLLKEYQISDIAAFIRAKADEPPCDTESQPGHHHLPANDKSIHWGFFSKSLSPVLEINSGDFVTIETLTHHAYDDYERMIKGDSGAESVFRWTGDSQAVLRRGAGPLDGSVYGRGAGEGLGVHICTGPISIRDSAPGDVVELRILDILPRASANLSAQGRTYGSNAATWWGFHYNQMLTNPKSREVITVFEIEGAGDESRARALYNYQWTPQTDPSGKVHAIIDYPGVPVDHDTIVKNYDVLKGISIPVRPHFGVIALAPKEAEIVDSVPPAYFGGNIDNWRAGKGTTIYLPVSVAGALLSVGDPHASQGDGEICGTAIECSLTGVFQVILHKKRNLPGTLFQDLNYPLLETKHEWIIHGFSYPNYLAELSEKAPSSVYQTSTLDFAMQDAFRKARRFLMTTKGLSEDEAISLISVAVDFGITQVVNGNWCVHAIIRKTLFQNA